jgi:hypothetical protein
MEISPKADKLSRKPCPETFAQLQKFERAYGGREISIFITSATDGWDHVALRRKITGL